MSISSPLRYIGHSSRSPLWYIGHSYRFHVPSTSYIDFFRQFGSQCFTALTVTQSIINIPISRGSNAQSCLSYSIISYRRVRNQSFAHPAPSYFITIRNWTCNTWIRFPHLDWITDTVSPFPYDRRTNITLKRCVCTLSIIIIFWECPWMLGVMCVFSIHLEMIVNNINSCISCNCVNWFFACENYTQTQKKTEAKLSLLGITL